MPNMAYQAFGVTIRPLDGITDEQICHVDDWIHKTCHYYHVITEKSGKERHLHAALFLKSCTTRSNLNNRMLSIKRMDLDHTEKKVLRSGTRIMYNHDFWSNYLDKGDETVEISSNIPDDLDILEAFYPEQGDKRMVKQFKGSTWYVRMEQLWQESDFVINDIKDEEHVRAFLHKMMFVDRKIEVIDDPRRLAGKVKALVKFLIAEEMEVEYTMAPEVEALLGRFS